MNVVSPSAKRFTVVYRVTPQPGISIDREAEEITIEQTVEVPRDCIPAGHFTNGIVGKVEAIEPIVTGANAFRVSISYRLDITAFNIPQFLNVMFGNISLKKNIRIIGFDFQPGIEAVFPGPRHGIVGLRKITGVFGRPLACVALKPMGLGVGELADMAGCYAAGGADLIKDDHGIGDQHFHRFEERVARCQEAVERSNAMTGRKTLYLPTIWGGFDRIDRQVSYALGLGVRGLLVAPVLLGLDCIRHIRQTYGPVIMAHPSFGGSWVHESGFGMTPAVLYGTLFRMIGADISIFPNAGGRFFFTTHECRDLCAALRDPLVEFKPAFPCPAGGMTFERVDEMAVDFGVDTVLLIGGALMRYADDRTIATRAFMEKIRARFGEHLEPPADGPASACEWRPPIVEREPVGDGIYPFSNFRWGDSRPESYKSNDTLPFRGISRQELITPANSTTRFDMRYFEIEPGGFSSFEKHVHEHVIIGVRGCGVLVKGGREYPIGVNDLAHVGSLESHQMQNHGAESFGFYCIVDRMRDKPIAAGVSP
jgi:ribulose-bisphosphate carboxylase large chain